MSYGLIYKVYIPSVRKNAYYLEIEKKDYTGECSTITGGEVKGPLYPLPS